MKSMRPRLLFALALCQVSAHASTILYADSGTLDAATGSTTTPSLPEFSAASDTWSFSFEAERNPTISDVGMGGFDFAFSDFSYFLNGSPVSITPTFIRFFSGTNGGGFLICFNGATAGTCTDGLGPALFGQSQMYSGTTSAPTLEPGAFSFTGFAFEASSNVFFEPNTTVSASAIPEPSTFLYLAVPLLAIGWRKYHRK